MKNLCSSLLVIVVVAISGAIGKKISENPPIPILINPAHHVFQPRYEPFQPLQKLLDLENEGEDLKNEIEQVANSITANSALATAANTLANAASTQAAAAQAAVDALAQKPETVFISGCCSSPCVMVLSKCLTFHTGQGIRLGFEDAKDSCDRKCGRLAVPDSTWDDAFTTAFRDNFPDAVTASPFFIGARTSGGGNDAHGIDGSVIPNAVISLADPLGQPIRMTVPSAPANTASYNSLTNPQVRHAYVCEYNFD